ncbi:MAG: cation diffusion facilitator family transporter [Candidatus Micrarchaeia archaeon]
MSEKLKSTKIGLIANFLLLIIKLYFGLISGSLALLSDALNSFTDILASIGIYLAVKEGQKKNDSDHQFGHYAAEPLSAFVVSILAAILAFEILKSAVEKIISPSILNVGLVTIGVVLLVLVTKSVLYFYFRSINKKEPSQAMQAYMMDSKNDVGVSVIVLFGVAGAFLGYPMLDSVSAILVSLYIFKNAFDLGKKNVNFLMGSSPEREVIYNFEKLILKNKKVKNTKVIAHYFGDTFHLDITIKVDKELNVAKAHLIAEEVKKEILKQDDISHVQVHVEPY